MPFAMTLACFGMRMTIEEALVAATLNAASALDRRGPRRVARARQALRPRRSCDGDLVDLLRVGADAVSHRREARRGRLLPEGVSRVPARSHVPRPPRRVRVARADAGRRFGSRLAGAIGASLLLMVCAHAEDADRAPTPSARALDAQTAGSSMHLRQRLAALVDEDSAAYESVVAAFRLPEVDRRGEGGAASWPSRRRRACATETPLAVMRACVAALDAAQGVAARGNPNAASDVRVGIALLAAARPRAVRERGDQPAGPERRGRAGGTRDAARTTRRGTSGGRTRQARMARDVATSLKQLAGRRGPTGRYSP